MLRASGFKWVLGESDSTEYPGISREAGPSRFKAWCLELRSPFYGFLALDGA